MEILNTTTHIYEFWFMILFIGSLTLFILFLTGLFWFYMIAEKDLKAILPTIIFTGFSVLTSFAFVMIINEGAEVTHNVKVHDWNAIYDKGYEVLKHEGDIVTIKLK